jgi:DNA-directed RNA polymerase specialized sigma24 family protein
MKVQEAKLDGLTSGEVAKKLNMPLEQVNELWIE